MNEIVRDVAVWGMARGIEGDCNSRKEWEKSDNEYKKDVEMQRRMGQGN